MVLRELLFSINESEMEDSVTYPSRMQFIIHRKMQQIGDSSSKKYVPKWFHTKIPIPVLPLKKAAYVLTFKIPCAGGFQEHLEIRVGSNCMFK